MSIIDDLITDRAETDVLYLQRLLSKDWETLTEEELNYYFGQSDTEVLYALDGQLLATDSELYVVGTSHGVVKGAYNYIDLNRVGAAMLYVADRLTRAGYLVEISPKTDWTETDYMTSSSAAHYLADLEELRTKFALYETTPDPPADMEFLTYTEANNIEKILEDIDALLTNIMTAWYYSGDLFSGEV